MRHFITNIEITPTESGASGECYGMVIAAIPAGKEALKGVPLFYRDTLVKTPRGWRFKAREFWSAKEAH